MEFRVSSWNVNNRNFRDSHLELLRQVDSDVVMLQEVSRKFYDQLASSGWFEWAAFSLDLRPPSATEGRSRRLGCAIFGRSPFRLCSSELLRGLQFPEPALVVNAEASSLQMKLCSFHTPPGVSWGDIKPKTLCAIAEWLTKESGYVIFGIDANAPKTDHPIFEKNEWWWDEEPVLLGHSPRHQLRDCLRVYFQSRSEMLADIALRRPNGPLAVSHVRGNGRKMTDCRYDFIYIPPGIEVLDVSYLHEEALLAGSDHALVSALLRIAEESRH